MEILLLLLTAIPLEAPVTDRVVTIELNHLLTTDARGHVLSQWIFWGRTAVIDWRMAEVQRWPYEHPPHPEPCQDARVPRYRPRHHTVIRDGDGWVLLFTDSGGVLRRVWARSYVESCSTYDPEVQDRGRLPTAKRAKLGGREP